MAASKINMRRKMTLVLVFGLLGFCAVAAKLAVIQFVQGNELQLLAERDRTRDMKVAAARGAIYDVNGNKLAISITADSIVANPVTVQSSNEDGNSLTHTATFLSGLLSKDYETIHQLLSSNQSYVYLERKVDFGIAELIRFENLPGIHIEEETQRYYPRGTLAAHVLGFAGIDNQGLWGVELALEEYLVGSDGSIVGQYDALGESLPQAEYQYVPPEDGMDVYLTIDENIQYFCERELAALMASETPPKQAGIIIMDPKTNAIKAMACTDPYDPNHYYDYPESSWRNFLVSDSYEPGSTFKIITAATALEEGTVDLNSSFYDPGSITVAGSTIDCWTTVPHGMQTLAEAVQNSCNPAFVNIGLGIEAKEKGLFYKYIQAFGYGQKTNVALNGEAIGILQAPENVNMVETATIAIGQGIAVTPIQMITAVCAVANDGVLLEPQIVSKVMSGETVVYELTPKPVRQVVSEETAKLLRELLVGVVTDGSGANAAIEGYTIAGKTGTAQKPGDGGYAAGRYVSSFIGMVPAEAPELVCLVVVDEPSGVFYGSQVAAPIFKNVVSDTLRYLGISPSATANDGLEPEKTDNISVQVPNLVNFDVESARQKLQAAGLEYMIEGDGPLVTSQMPAALTFAENGSTVMLRTGGVSSSETGAYITVPHLSGKRFAEVANLLSSLSLVLSAEGSGIAVSQSPQEGEVVPEGTTISVKFQEEQQIIQTLDP